MATNESPVLSLFPDLSPAETWWDNVLRGRLLHAYVAELLRDRPIKSLDPDQVGEESARRTGEYIAHHQDVPRFLRAVRAADLELSSAGRMADLLEIVADFLATYDHDCARGGGGPEDESETLDFDALIRRARTAITPGYRRISTTGDTR